MGFRLAFRVQRPLPSGAYGPGDPVRWHLLPVLPTPVPVKAGRHGEREREMEGERTAAEARAAARTKEQRSDSQGEGHHQIFDNKVALTLPRTRSLPQPPSQFPLSPLSEPHHIHVSLATSHMQGSSVHQRLRPPHRSPPHNPITDFPLQPCQCACPSSACAGWLRVSLSQMWVGGLIGFGWRVVFADEGR